MSNNGLYLEILNKSGIPIKYADLGEKFLEDNNLEGLKINNDIKIRLDEQESKAGNIYYTFSQNGLPLPDGLDTIFKINDILLPLSPTKPSKKGYHASACKKVINFNNVDYIADIYISKSMMPYYIKVHLHKKPDTTEAIRKAQMKPKGGSFI